MTDQRDTPGPLRPEQVQAIRERMLRAVESEPGDFQCAKGEECEVCDGVLAVRQGAELLAALLADREQREGEIKRLREALEGLVKWCDKHDWGAVPMTLESRARAALAVAPKEETR